MKNIIRISGVILLIVSFFIIHSCKKDKPSPPVVMTVAVSAVTQTTSVSGGTITSDGGANITSRGVCWNTSADPTISNSITNDGTGTGTFASSLTGLTINTTYYLKAYATNSAGTAYGNEISFTTSSALVPTLTTTVVSLIAQITAASGGTITNDGGASVTSRGVCWNTSANPTISNSKTTDGTGTGTFASSLTGLTVNTTYYLRAYATNSAGTAYGDELSFKTASATVPTLTTTAVSSITQSSAASGGNITSDGGASVTTRGVCWNTSGNATISNSTTTDGAGTGLFTSSLTGLTINTTYYLRAYATNSAGTGYGNELIFKTLAGTITDIDGNVYNIVTIGTQIWMAENLRTTRYNDGTSIPFFADTAFNSPAYTQYTIGLDSYGSIYGGLYNWFAVNTGKLCPTGWHVSSDFEWSALMVYIGGQGTGGGKLKEAGYAHWSSPNYGATNEYGFTGLPGGARDDVGYRSLGLAGYWWSSTEIPGGSYAYYHAFYYDQGNIINSYYKLRSFYFSIRCIKD